MAPKAEKKLLEKKPAAGEKWDHLPIDYYANKKSRISELETKSESHSSTESEVRSQPMGQFRANRQERNKTRVSKEAIEKCEKIQQIEEEMMKLRGIELEQKKIEFELKEIELLQKDYDIVLMDTSKLTDAQREFYSKFVDEIRARRKW